MKSPWEGFMDIAVHTEPYPYVTYRTANFVFEEGLRDGRWVSLYYNAAGYSGDTNPNPLPSCVELDAPAQPESFDVVLDGQSLDGSWSFQGCDVQRDEGKITACVSLAHGYRPVRVKIFTVADGTCALERRVEVENLSDRPAAISAFAPLCGGVQTLSGNRGWYEQFRPEAGRNIWRLGCFAGSGMQATEGDFRWEDLPAERYSLCGRYRRDRYRHPFFILNNKLSGEYLIVQFAWSGGYSFDFDYLYDWGIAPTLSMRIGLDSPAPMRVLAPGEKWTGPEVHFGMVFGGLDEAVNGMNRHLRKVFMPKPAEQMNRIAAGFGPEFHMDLKHTLQAVDYAAAVGAELFFIDAGWYVHPGAENGTWHRRVGDWKFDPERYPNGIAEVRDYCHERGLLFGVWMEPERIGDLSGAYQRHRDWLLPNRKGQPNSQGYLDLGIPACAQWMEEQISCLIEENKLDFFRLDFNAHWPEMVGQHAVFGYRESAFVRNQQAVYGIFERLRRKFPHVIFENCASGGGRTDVGMMKYFHQTWVADYQRHPNAFRITNGMTMALPPEYVTRMIGGQHSYLTADLRTALRNLIFTQFSVCGILRDDLSPHDRQMEEIRHTLEIYRNFIRPILADCDIYHHTPELPGYPPAGFGILELDSSDGTKGVLGVFRLSDPCETETVIRLRGIDPSRRYRVTSDNGRASHEAEGWQLTEQGIRVRLEGPLTSELVLYEAL